jgi:dolichyl-phosphate-mannose-protein mannosyltransferase
MKAYQSASAADLAEPADPAAVPPATAQAEHGPPAIPGSAFWGWAGPLLVTLFGGFLRFYRLGQPKAVVFDETYYVPDANSILHHGVELNHVGWVNRLLVAGDANFYKLSNGLWSGSPRSRGGQLVGELVAHPPLGKMMMAVGQWTFGLTPFGWRFSVAVVGTLSILMTARIARRMTRSTMLGCVAGLLLALDGLELVLSRTAILDIFVMFWVLAAFGLLVLDRDRTRARLAAAAAADPDDRCGPKLGIRWLRVLAGVCIGAAIASKWNGLWYLFAFGALAIIWDLGARRAAGYREWLAGGLRSDAKWLPAWCLVVPAAIYTATWSGWFATSDGWDRNWAAQHGNHTPIWSTIDSWYQYQHWMLNFGLTLSAFQSYKSNPVGWLVLARPISFYWATPPGCGSSSCASEVLAIGTPAIWWGGTLALVFCLFWWLSGFIGDLVFDRLPVRDWRAGAVLLGVLAGWVPWIWYAWHDNRTEFYYYAIAFDPFLVIAITLCLGLIIGKSRAAPARRAVGAVGAGAYLFAVLLNFAYLYPILTAQVIPYTSWLSRMWFHRWI